MEDKFFEHGSQNELYAEAGFGVADIQAKAAMMLADKLAAKKKMAAS
jgi:hypothetical protein